MINYDVFWLFIPFADVKQMLKIRNYCFFYWDCWCNFFQCNKNDFKMTFLMPDTENDACFSVVLPWWPLRRGSVSVDCAHATCHQQQSEAGVGCFPVNTLPHCCHSKLQSKSISLDFEVWEERSAFSPAQSSDEKWWCDNSCGEPR